ncbi:BTB/POZ and MATH domain-containing protein 2-like [Panicum miliaceum]|uniref:BTB/POZ and MATH domain-containing protein 2-like n=1 Tax=Panicum miliaceum TaxID=4540 RepID=A0A3L6QAU4_PANMI|nr:BTB/POZ and MATH domain-containing protein 2-like [Panicum miliaceum]
MADVSAHHTSPRRRGPPDTSSRCRAEKVTGTHDFEVANYSLLDGRIGAGRSIKSAPFSVGGYTWIIEFYPDGQSMEDCCCCCMSAASAFVSICDGAVTVNAKYTLSLVDRDGRAAASWLWRRRSATVTYGWPHPRSWGFKIFYLKPLLRFSRCLDDDRLKIRCQLTVFTPPRTEDTTPAPAPPPELPGHLERALKDGRGADVTFGVAGREFRAHRVLLAARSPVFDAELLGPMAERDARRVVRIEDMEPAVFEMLLHFIYTDSPPGSLEGYSTATAQDLLVAADRYGVERLKLMCAEKLCKSIDVSTVMTTLALADQHHCQELKEACIAFMSSPKVLRVLVATDEFKHLMATCPQLASSKSVEGASVEKN